MAVAWETRRSDDLGEAVFTAVFPSGFRVRFLPKRGFRKKVAVLSVRFGALHGDFLPPGAAAPLHAPAGTAHFLEHRIFHREEGDAFLRFGALGASSNAATSHTRTTYYFSCVERFHECLATLLGFLDGLHVDAKGVEDEKRIVEEEIRGYDDSPGWVAHHRLMACLYVRSHARFDIAGTSGSLRAIDVGSLRAAYDAFYHPGNAELSVSGDLEPGPLLETVERALRGRGPRPPATLLPPVEPAHVAARGTRAVRAVPRPKVHLGFKERDADLAGPARALRRFEQTVLLSALAGRASDFFRDAYDEGLLDETFSVQSTREPGLAHVVFSADVDDPAAFAGRVLGLFDAARRRGVDPEDVRRILKRERGRVLRHFNHPESAAFALQHFASAGVELLDVPALLDRVTPEGVDRVLAAGFDPAAHALSAVVPPGARG